MVKCNDQCQMRTSAYKALKALIDRLACVNAAKLVYCRLFVRLYFLHLSIVKRETRCSVKTNIKIYFKIYF